VYPEHAYCLFILCLLPIGEHRSLSWSVTSAHVVIEIWICTMLASWYLILYPDILRITVDLTLPSSVQPKFLKRAKRIAKQHSRITLHICLQVALSFD
jgi:hypothetical protein